MKMYIFPLNFDYANKFLGVFEYKTLTPSCIMGFFIALIISKLCTDAINRNYALYNSFFPIVLLIKH